ncbi:MAG: hypothetical protein IPL67_19600 [Ignavibacteria bacterium]|nr:hypothetical protein [Ignavibacteria bacterium]
MFPSGGELNTAPAVAAAFTPTSSQWRPKIYLLPVGTNKVRLRARSGFGNNLYIDNVCIKLQINPVSQTIGIQTEGIWRFPNPPVLNDTFKVYYHRVDFPNIIVDSGKGVIDASYVLTFDSPRAESGNYYRVVKHRNAIITWSANGIFYARGNNTSYNFLFPAGQSYGNNMAPIPSQIYYAMYSGDVNQDKTIDGTDVGRVDNDAANFVGGYVVTDLTGDSFVDGTDFALADNNAANFVAAVEPPGASPLISTPVESDNSVVPEFENDLQRQKYEEGKRLSSQQQVVDQPKKQTYKEYLEMKRNEYSKNTQK